MTHAFTPQAAADYDARIPALVPGYDLAGNLAAALLCDLLPDGARILVAGCGTGAELARLVRANASWRFIALDPSPAMLVRARERMAASGDGERVVWVEAPLGAADLPACDAALAFLVDHFVPDDGARARFFAALAQPLAGGAPALLFHYSDGPWTGAYGRWLAMAESGQKADAILGLIATRWHLLTPERRTALLEQAGFSAPRRFLSALGYEGVLALRNTAELASCPASW